MPDVDMDGIYTEKKSRCTCTCRFGRGILSKSFQGNFLLILAVIGYMCFGAAVFVKLEFGGPSKSNSVLDTPENTALLIWQINATNYSTWAGEVASIITVFRAEQYCGPTFLPDVEQWGFLTGLFLCMTAITTIGYGTVTPASKAGRLFLTFYSILGIPLFLLFLSNFGVVVAAITRDKFKSVRRIAKKTTRRMSHSIHARRRSRSSLREDIDLAKLESHLNKYYTGDQTEMEETDTSKQLVDGLIADELRRRSISIFESDFLHQDNTSTVIEMDGPNIENTLQENLPDQLPSGDELDHVGNELQRNATNKSNVSSFTEQSTHVLGQSSPPDGSNSKADDNGSNSIGIPPDQTSTPAACTANEFCAGCHAYDENTYTNPSDKLNDTREANYLSTPGSLTCRREKNNCEQTSLDATSSQKNNNGNHAETDTPDTSESLAPVDVLLDSHASKHLSPSVSLHSSFSRSSISSAIQTTQISATNNSITALKTGSTTELIESSDADSNDGITNTQCARTLEPCIKNSDLVRCDNCNHILNSKTLCLTNKAAESVHQKRISFENERESGDDSSITHDFIYRERSASVFTIDGDSNNPQEKALGLLASIYLVYTLGGTLLFIEWEKGQEWDFINSFYFCVTTLTTIGFGDLMINLRHEDGTEGIKEGKLILFIIYTCFGLVLLSACFSLAQQKVKRVAHKLMSKLHVTQYFHSCANSCITCNFCLKYCRRGEET
ncbi:uncharacterized protein LOC144351302 [Saccoglossus kowalevskii]